MSRPIKGVVPKYSIGFVAYSRGGVKVGDPHDFAYDSVVQPVPGLWVNHKGEAYLIVAVAWNILAEEGECDFDCLVITKEEAEKYGNVA
jgi:hypothetical protein